MQVSLSVLREVKVDDYVHSLDVNTSSEQVYWMETVWVMICKIRHSSKRVGKDTYRCRPGFCTVHF